MLVACGDGIDERGDIADTTVATADTAVTSTTSAARPPRLSPEALAIRVQHSTADYSGSHSVVKLSDGSWLLSGFDNHSDRSQPERGALWRSDDLHTWQRTGTDISDPPGQQTISSLVVVDDTVVAVGSDLSAITSADDGDKIDAVAWTSTDRGDHFDRVVVQRHAHISGAMVRNGTIWAWGEGIGSDRLNGQIWTSTDAGASWSAVDPKVSLTPGRSPSAPGPIAVVLDWDGTLVAVGATTATDPDGADVELTATDLFQSYSSDPLDIAIWYSDDEGAHWLTASPTGLAGVEWAQFVSSATVVGDELVIAGGTGAPVAGGIASGGAFDGKWTSTIWTCDHPLQHCEVGITRSNLLDFTSSAVVTAGDRAVFAIRGVDYPSEYTTSIVGMFDPATNLATAMAVEGVVGQVEAIVIDDGTIYFFGHNDDTNLLQVASAELPA